MAPSGWSINNVTITNQNFLNPTSSVIKFDLHKPAEGLANPHSWQNFELPGRWSRRLTVPTSKAWHSFSTSPRPPLNEAFFEVIKHRCLELCDDGLAQIPLNIKVCYVPSMKSQTSFLAMTQSATPTQQLMLMAWICLVNMQTKQYSTLQKKQTSILSVFQSSDLPTTHNNKSFTTIASSSRLRRKPWGNPGKRYHCCGVHYQCCIQSQLNAPPRLTGIPCQKWKPSDCDCLCLPSSFDSWSMQFCMQASLGFNPHHGPKWSAKNHSNLDTEVPASSSSSSSSSSQNPPRIPAYNIGGTRTIIFGSNLISKIWFHSEALGVLGVNPWIARASDFETLRCVSFVWTSYDPTWLVELEDMIAVWWPNRSPTSHGRSIAMPSTPTLEHPTASSKSLKGFWALVPTVSVGAGVWVVQQNGAKRPKTLAAEPFFWKVRQQHIGTVADAVQGHRRLTSQKELQMSGKSGLDWTIIHSVPRLEVYFLMEMQPVLGSGSTTTTTTTTAGTWSISASLGFQTTGSWQLQKKHRNQSPQAVFTGGYSRFASGKFIMGWGWKVNPGKAWKWI